MKKSGTAQPRPFKVQSDIYNGSRKKTAIMWKMAQNLQNKPSHKR